MYSKFDITINSLDASILVVDDEPANVKLLVKLLSLQGYTNIVSTVNPEDVMSLYKENNFDLIILDLDMPILDGFAIMDQFKLIDEDLSPSILVLTAQHMQSYKQRALDNGAHDYVTKPFDANELSSRVRNLLQVHLSHKFMLSQNEILERKVAERTQSLHETRLKIVRHLGRAAEYRDNETGLHIIRMSKIAVVLAKAAGFDNKQCDLLLNAAPMHDIGKIGIPDSILLKPGKLDKEQWDIMQTHVQIGAEILSGDDSDLMCMAHDIALSHHEKWNGKGYPNKLSGKDIPLVGRITALADVFDALTSERPYKKAWSLDDALKYLKSEKCEHFDPELVDLFLVNVDEIVLIKDKYAEPSQINIQNESK